ncbi:hypothetical protein PIB30_009620 [Stylosanthes scabra]|uniref:Uncharacterized protein n=1 Tax=Stylosanthes scabra TaxID=79078 RepID=A0ABU6S5L9_9FABA|nr:hypothetical protein [Stylosanthes scabra]
MSNNNNYNSSTFDEQRWVINIRKTLEEELDEDQEFEVHIFNVPKLLMASDPDSYVPQQVAIGPYHYWRPELYEMQRYKVAAAQRFQKSLQSQQQCLKFEEHVQKLLKFERKIRRYYHKYLDFSGETLVWMMAVDASFLLEFLQIYAIQEGTKIPGVSSSMSHLVDYAGKKSAHNAILRDIVMLENQIPFFVLRKMLEFKFSSLEAADDMLSLILTGLFNELSPFKTMEQYPNNEVSKSVHILDYLYDMIVPRQYQEIVEEENYNQDGEKKGNDDENLEEEEEKGNVKKFLSDVWNILSKMNKGPVRLVKRVLVSKPLKLVVKLPWQVISNTPVLKLMKEPLERMVFARGKGGEDDEKKEKGSSSGSKIEEDKPPLVEEITIPSVSELVNSGVRISPVNGCISSISFDAKTCTLYLPVIALDVNTEVFLRNLVAYEASSSSGKLVVSRYTEFMNGIIDTEEDAKILRERGIVLNHLKSDLEVANMWNGMNKSLRLSKVPKLDMVIEDVNKFYSGTTKVKVQKFMKVYVFGSWQLLTFLAAIFMLFLMGLQAFCSVYTCSRFFQSLQQSSSDNSTSGGA